MSGLDLLVEVGTEEIPAGYIGPALAAWEERLAKALTEARLQFGTLKTYATPRRLTIVADWISEQQPDFETEAMGPPVKVAYDEGGNPTKAALGFAQREGVDVSELLQQETEKGLYVMVRKKIAGRPAEEIVTELLPPLILGLPFPKSMRWGAGSTVFVRPIHWLLAVMGGRILPMMLGDIQASNKSRGHRFMSTDLVEINSASEYEEKLEKAGVVVDIDRRREMVRREIALAVAKAGKDMIVLPDDDLVDEVANLVEIPVASLGGFHPSFLELPAELPVTAMREHQRYFALADDQGNLKPHFIAINNTQARDINVVSKGHERVLTARLEDARFYFKDDIKTTLESKQDELKRVVFHSLMGTSWQKVERFSKVAGYLADTLVPGVKDHLLRAAALCKCDLVSGVVGEFPSLQGIMGREYALRDGEHEDVATAILEHYLPSRAGGELPITQTGALLSIADKIDTITGCFGVGLIPTGAADPYALRRQALGIIAIILDKGYRLSLGDLVEKALDGLSEWLKRPAPEVKADVMEFIRLRLKNQLTGQGISADGAEAVLSLYHDDLVTAVAKVRALEEIKAKDDFLDLAAAFKRVVNIIKKFGAQDRFSPDGLIHEAEKNLWTATQDLHTAAETLIEENKHSDLINRIATLKPVVDNFFDQVLVDDPDPEVKANRLGLLTQVTHLFETAADFTKITT